MKGAQNKWWNKQQSNTWRLKIENKNILYNMCPRNFNIFINQKNSISKFLSIKINKKKL